MIKENQDKQRLSVDGLANNIQEMQKSTRMTAFFKSILLKKLKGLKIGGLTIVDGPKSYAFGESSPKLHATEIGRAHV